MSNMIKVKWHLSTPVPEMRIFKFDIEKASWKKQLIRGYDVAELIAQELYDTEVLTVKHIHIVDPKHFAGIYEIATNFEPHFSAKKLEIAKAEKPTKIKTESYPND